MEDDDHTRREEARKAGENLPYLPWEEMLRMYPLELQLLQNNNSNNHAAAAVIEHPAASMEPSPNVTLPLYKFQKEWLAWGTDREGSDVRGGIFADEMGMGKTIQAIALVVTARDRRAVSGGSCSNNRCTLVVCPLGILTEWQKEIENCTAKGSVRVLTLDGVMEPAAVEELKVDFGKYDFVLTSYSKVQSDYMKHVMPRPRECPFCRKKFNAARFSSHIRYCSEIAKNVNAALYKQLCEEDLEQKSDEKNKTTSVSALHSVRWERIILDEAHAIRGRNSIRAKAVYALESEYKWALTGTPLQNRMGDILSLIRFLQVFPFSHYFCTHCDCSIHDLDHSAYKHCPSCNHSTARHFSWWNKFINTPLKHSDQSQASKKLAMFLLNEKVLKSVLLRREKSDRATGYVCQPKLVKVRRDTMDQTELECYQALLEDDKNQTKKLHGKAEDLMSDFPNPRTSNLLIRMRQAAAHPYLVKFPPQEICGICKSKAKDTVLTTPCDHAFCSACWLNHFLKSGTRICPTCKEEAVSCVKMKPKIKSKPNVKGFRSSSILNRLDLPRFRTSTKIEALKEEIRNMIEEDGSAKGIVFSQFPSFLDLIAYSLNMCGIKWVMVDGVMKIEDKQKVIAAFNDDADCKILLMSLTAGVVASNLTVASYVFLMDPSCNPASEKQAIDRIHRIGQHKPVRVIKFVMQHTVEERILLIQHKKELAFEGAVGNFLNEVHEELTAEDMYFLFSA